MRKPILSDYPAERYRKETKVKPTSTETVRVEDVLARRLRQLRAERDLSQEALAEVIASYGRWKPAKLGIARIEQGNRKVKVEELLDLAAALEVGVVDLLRPYPGEFVEVGPYQRHRIAEQIAGEVAWSDRRNFRSVFQPPGGDWRVAFVEGEAPRAFSFRQTEGNYGYLWELLADLRVKTAEMVMLERRITPSATEPFSIDLPYAEALAYEVGVAVEVAKKRLDDLVAEVASWLLDVQETEGQKETK
jgi:transcriptional regulator with XRE-family HTH domain